LLEAADAANSCVLPASWHTGPPTTSRELLE
jgi:hypothetical protein